MISLKLKSLSLTFLLVLILACLQSTKAVEGQPAVISVFPSEPSYDDDFVVVIKVNATYLETENLKDIQLIISSNTLVLCSRNLSLSPTHVFFKQELCINKAGNYDISLTVLNATGNTTLKIAEQRITVRKLRTEIILEKMTLEENGSSQVRVAVVDEKGRPVNEGKISVNGTEVPVMNGVAEIRLPRLGNYTVMYEGTERFQKATRSIELKALPVRVLLFEIRNEEDVRRLAIMLAVLGAVAVTPVYAALLSYRAKRRTSSIESRLQTFEKSITELKNENNMLSQKVKELQSENNMLKQKVHECDVNLSSVRSSYERTREVAARLRNLADRSGRYSDLLNRISGFIEEPPMNSQEIETAIEEEIEKLENMSQLHREIYRKIIDKYNEAVRKTMKFHYSVDTSVVEDLLERALKEIDEGSRTLDPRLKMAHYKAAEALINEALSLLDRKGFVDRFLKLRRLGYYTSFELREIQ